MNEEEQMIQRLTAQAGQLQQYVDQLDKSLADLEALRVSLREFSDLKKGDKIHAPLANGIFVEASLLDSTKLLVNVGEGVVVRKTIPETIKLLEKQEKEILKSKEEIEGKIEEFYSSLG